MHAAAAVVSLLCSPSDNFHPKHLLLKISVCDADGAEVPHIPAGTYACLVTGTQEASKGRDGPECSNQLHVLLCVIRLPQHGSDLLVTVNAPTYISPSSRAAPHADIEGSQPAAQVQAAAVMQGVLESLVIRDEGLFG